MKDHFTATPRLRGVEARCFAYLVLAALIIFPGLSRSGEIPDSELSEEMARENLQRIEAWTRNHNSSVLDVAGIQTAIGDLKNHPEISSPLLADHFIDRAKEAAYRANCAEILREMGYRLPESYAPKLKAIIREGKESPILRIDAANLLLRSRSPLDTRSRKSIREMAARFLRDGKEPGRVYQLILKELVALKDAGTETLLLNELQRGADVGPALHALGKLGSRSAAAPIAATLNAHMSDRFYPRSRGYLALGEIGGSRAFDLLSDFLQREKSSTEKGIILSALGLTKDPRAKDTLLGFVTAEKPGINPHAALEGLQYLGDKSVIPLLKKELEKEPASSHNRFWLQRTIDALNAGRDRPDW